MHEFSSSWVYHHFSTIKAIESKTNIYSIDDDKISLQLIFTFNRLFVSAYREHDPFAKLTCTTLKSIQNYIRCDTGLK